MSRIFSWILTLFYIANGISSTFSKPIANAAFKADHNDISHMSPINLSVPSLSLVRELLKDAIHRLLSNETNLEINVPSSSAPTTTIMRTTIAGNTSTLLMPTTATTRNTTTMSTASASIPSPYKNTKTRLPLGTVQVAENLRFWNPWRWIIVGAVLLLVFIAFCLALCFGCCMKSKNLPTQDYTTVNKKPVTVQPVRSDETDLETDGYFQSVRPASPTPRVVVYRQLCTSRPAHQNQVVVPDQQMAYGYPNSNYPYPIYGDFSTVHRWVREYNFHQNLSEENFVSFYFHNTRGRTFPYYEIEDVLHSHSIVIVYIVANKTFHYIDDVDHKFNFMSWLYKLDNPLIQHPIEWYDLDSFIGNASECDNSQKYVLLIHDPIKCYDELWENSVRSFYGTDQLIFAEAQRPLTSETEVVLSTRLPMISRQCSMMIVMQRGAYAELPVGLYPHELHQAVLDWSNPSCLLSEPFSIKGPLTDIQLEYLREEKAIKNLEANPTFIVVGAIGGIAVVALAISIFWGLNGSSFA